jgi:hypothetical protein
MSTAFDDRIYSNIYFAGEKVKIEACDTIVGLDLMSL